MGRGERIGEVKGVDTELVGHGNVGVIGHADGDPVVSADGFEPPNLIAVAKCNAIHLVGAILLKQCTQALNAFTSAFDIGEYQGNHVFFADTANHFRFIVGIAWFSLSFFVLNQRICTEHALV